MALRSCGSVACPAIGDAVVVKPAHAVCLMYRVVRFCCRCAPDREQATLLQGICGVAKLWERGLSRDRRRSRRKTCACGLSDAPHHPILLPLRARSRDKPRSYKGFVALRSFVSSAEFIGENMLANLTHYLWERGLSRDRRRSRRKTCACGLSDAPRHPILLPLRARSRASHAPTGDLWRCQNLCRAQNLWE